MDAYNPVLSAPSGANKKPKRVGRGSSSGHGTTSGKGNKGQQSRSGVAGPYVGFEGGQMPLYRRVAIRGFSNAPFKKMYVCINLNDLNAKFNDGDVVNKEALMKKGIISKTSATLVKVLGDGDITKKITVEVDKISQSAKDKIEKAGGTVKAEGPVAKKVVAKPAPKADAKQEKTTSSKGAPKAATKPAATTNKKADAPKPSNTEKKEPPAKEQETK